MPRLFEELAFAPSVPELLAEQVAQKVTVLTGSNNSGKSAYLKKMSFDKSKLYIGVNRFYSFHHMSLYSYNERELDDFFTNLSNNNRSQYQNFEGSFFNTNTAIARLSDARREQLFRVFRKLFGSSIDVEAEFPDNQFSQRFISINGESLSVTSSGTRLFIGVLAAMMDERFSVVAIDEPELGLSPLLQGRLASIMIDRSYDEDLFPHNPHFVISTHSHCFLDKKTPSNNFVVNKEGNLIRAERCSSFQQLVDIQFRLLGNDLSTLFLPDAIVLVEGETDKMYIDNVLRLLMPEVKVVVEPCGGNIASRLQYWANALGDFQISPYRIRTFVVYDLIKQAGHERICERLGIPKANMIEWTGNGIEYMYPLPILSEIYRHSMTSHDVLTIDGDRVVVGEQVYTKMDLANRVCSMLRTDTVFPAELHEKMLIPLKDVLSH